METARKRIGIAMVFVFARLGGLPVAMADATNNGLMEIIVQDLDGDGHPDINVHEQATVAFTIDTERQKAGMRVAVFFGSKPDQNDTINDARLLAYGLTDSNGHFTVTAVVPDGLAGQRVYVQAFALLDDGKIHESITVGFTIVPDKADADWMIYPSYYIDLDTGKQYASSYPIQDAYQQSVPGDVLWVTSGLHPEFSLTRPCQDVNQAMTWIIGEPGTTIQEHEVSGSATINVTGCNVAMKNLTIRGSDLYVISVPYYSYYPTPATNIWFLDCWLKGTWFPDANMSTRWGVLTWNIAGFLFAGGGVDGDDDPMDGITRYIDEHCLYDHNGQQNQAGDRLTVENWSCLNTGITGYQATARSTESDGSEGKGNVQFRNVYFANHGVAGGSTITLAGRSPTASYLFSNVTVREGFDADWPYPARGAFVSHYGGGSENIDNGPVFFTHSDLQIAPTKGDRTHVSVDATSQFSFQDGVAVSGKSYALEIMGGAKAVCLDRESTVTGNPKVDVKAFGINYPNYGLLLDALYGSKNDCDM